MDRFTEIGEETVKCDLPVIIAEDQVIFVGTEVDPLAYIKVISSEEGNIKLIEGENISVTHDVNNEVEGEYEIAYRVSDSRGACVTKAIKVTVIDIAPMSAYNVLDVVIEDQVIFIGEAFDPLTDVVITDREGNAIFLEKIEVVQNEVDINRIGTYEIVYKIFSFEGMEVMKAIKVTVVDLSQCIL